MGFRAMSVSGGKSTVYNITGDTTLTMAQHNNAIINANHASAVSTIDLPAVADAAGMRVTIILGQTVSSDFNIDGQSLSAIRMHAVADEGDEGTNTVWGQQRYIVYDESQGYGLGIAKNGVIGDICELVCTGNIWVAKCYSRTGTWFSDSNGTI